MTTAVTALTRLAPAVLSGPTAGSPQVGSGRTAAASRGSVAPSSHAFQCGHASADGVPTPTRSAEPYMVFRSLQATLRHSKVPSTAAMTVWKPSLTIPNRQNGQLRVKQESHAHPRARVQGRRRVVIAAGCHRAVGGRIAMGSRICLAARALSVNPTPLPKSIKRTGV